MAERCLKATGDFSRYNTWFLITLDTYVQTTYKLSSH